MEKYFLSYLDILEAEAIHILREVAGQFERPALLFSGGKDSITLVRLAEKAFRPGKFPFPLVHIDTGHNFPEVIEYRDNLVSGLGEKIIVRYVEDTIKKRGLIESKGKNASRNALQTYTLLDTIEEFKFDVCIGGGRGGEGKGSEKERGFPISNWTEFDVWNYIKRENIQLPEIYFAHGRNCVVRDGQLLALSEYINLSDDDIITNKKVRFRTVGDMTCTAGVESNAGTIDDVINELKLSRTSERGETRLDDKTSEAAMEDRKK